MRKYLSLILIMLMAGGSALADDEYSPDPWEGFNRKMFSFNEKADKYAFRPAALGYRKVTPKPVRASVANFFSNLGEVKVIASDVLQLKFVQASSDTGRFIVNSTLGFFGFFDVATHIGLKKHDEDFGQVLGYWGIGSGPYIMWPLLGPSTVRDSVGLGAEYASNISMVTFGKNEGQNLALTGLYGLSAREALLDAEGMVQGDRYVFIRSFYLQHREYLVKDGKIDDDFGDDDWDDWDDFDDEEF